MDRLLKYVENHFAFCTITATLGVPFFNKFYNNLSTSIISITCCNLSTAIMHEHGVIKFHLEGSWLMFPAIEGLSKVTFGLFEAHLQTGELWKAGKRIKIQSQPFKVLAALLERPGEIVSKEELQLRLWGKDTTVDFDHSLGTAINKIREALGDSADNPRFIETLAPRGYRFIAPVGSPPVPRTEAFV